VLGVESLSMILASNFPLDIEWAVSLRTGCFSHALDCCRTNLGAAFPGTVGSAISPDKSPSMF
jgi:hypothetical protein